MYPFLCVEAEIGLTLKFREIVPLSRRHLANQRRVFHDNLHRAVGGRVKFSIGVDAQQVLERAAVVRMANSNS
ncbi:MAG: hypothetical protein ACI9G1_005761 [Pirellulaceae bacterium]|jgi:hypothetical protein